jgi:tRNA 2-selenouridine synthase
MIESVSAITPETLSRYGDVIDVRSPAEFALDHVPGAINLPVLDNDQRREVGTLYVQQSKFLASRIGAAIVARNIADHLDGPLADKPGSWAPLIYCWRGGNRSGAMATILSRVGWRVGVLEGGYRTYRRGVVRRLYEESPPLRVVLVSGPTGSGKTVLLAHARSLGAQIIDLEALAAHRGSLFGGLKAEAQPSQRGFETRLLQALDALDPARPVLVEAESSHIGQISVPPAIWSRMVEAPRIEIDAPVAARARHIVETYEDITSDLAAIEEAVARLPRHISHEQREAWRVLARAGDFLDLAEQLIDVHYDPAYRRSESTRTGAVAARLVLDDLDMPSLAATATRLVGLAESVAG